jgi:hypothetical protein
MSVSSDSSPKKKVKSTEKTASVSRFFTSINSDPEVLSGPRTNRGSSLDLLLAKGAVGFK